MYCTPLCLLFIFYLHNNQRITTKLKGLTPVCYRNQSLII
ncbi:MAG: IS3 family transposase [Anaerorhabdus sp.]